MVVLSAEDRQGRWTGALVADLAAVWSVAKGCCVGLAVVGDVALDEMRHNVLWVGDWDPVFGVFWVFVKVRSRGLRIQVVCRRLRRAYCGCSVGQGGSWL